MEKPMGDEGEFWADLKAHQRALKDKFGEPCKECLRRFPKAPAKILLPGQYCYRCRYRDPRPSLSEADRVSVTTREKY
jgi:hypothetical protein